MGKVDDAQHTVQDIQARADEGIDATKDNAADESVDKECGIHGASTSHSGEAVDIAA